MSLSHRSLTAAGLSLFGLAVVFAACTDDGGSPVGPQPIPPVEKVEVATIECRVDIRGKAVVCKEPAPSAGAASGQFLGNQNVNVRLASDSIQVFADTFAFTVNITNVLPQPDDGRKQTLGVDSLGNPGPVDVFFFEGPYVTAGSGAIEVANEDGNAPFTASSQPYFTYSAVLDSGQTSHSRRWKLRFDPGVEGFFFRVIVSTPLRLPHGWVDVEPDSSLVATGDSVQLTATVKNFMGITVPGQTVTWSSGDSTIAKVNSGTGMVTAIVPGTAVITASTANPNRTGTAKVVVFTPNVPATIRNDTIDAITNVTVGLPAPRLKTKITDPDNNAVIVSETVATANGGVARIDSSGAYDYLSPAGYSGPDSFRFHVMDGASPDSGTVVVNVGASNYWYVQAGGTGDGRDRFPFGSLAAAQVAAATGDSIFVLANGATQLDGPGVLEDGQALIGQGIPTGYSTTLNGQTVTILAAGAAPGLTRTTAGPMLTVAQNNTVRGVGITAADGAAIAGSNFGTLTASDLGVNPRGPALELSTGTLAANFALLSSDSSNTTGISLDGVGGTLAAAGGLIRHPDGIAFRVNGGSLTFSYPGRILNTLDSAVVVTNLTGGAITLAENVEDAGGGIVVAGLTGGSVTFADSIALTGKGIDVHDNTAGSVAFNGLSKSVSTGANAGVALANNSGASVGFGGGGLAITTTSGAGFSATGGGLVQVTGAANTVATGTGTAVTLHTINTGGSGVVFHSVSANGAVNGIKLTSVTGAGFQVTGDASTPASGGTIQSPTGHGVELSTISAVPVELRFLDVTGAGAGGNAGIFTSAVDSLVVQTVNVSATGGPALSLANSKLKGTFGTLSSATSASSGLILNTVSGGFSATGGSITGPSGTAVAVIGGTVGMTYPGSVTQPNAAALLSVTGGHSGGTLAFSGALSASNGTGLQFDNADGTYTFTGTTTLGGGDAGIDVLNGSGGTFDIAGSAGSASITDPTNHAVRVEGSTPAFTYGGTISKTGATTGILVQNNTGGTIAFTGNSKVLSTSTATAVTLASNSGAAINFGGGGLAITTTLGNGLVASGGGTLQVTGANNTASSTGGVPVSLNGLALGASGVTFHSVSATGGANGIVLASLSGGGFQVTGDGATGGTGGSINGTTGAAVSLSSTTTTALNFMNLTAGVGNAAIFGSSFGTLSVNGTTLAATTGPALNLGTGTLNGTFASVGGTLVGAVKGVLLNTVAGSFTVSGGTLTGGTDSLMVVRGGTASASWQGNLAQANAHPLLAVVGGHGTGTLTFSGTLSATGGTGLQFSNADGNYTFSGTTTLNGGDAGVDITGGSDGTFTFGTGTSITNPSGTAFNFNGSTAAVTYSGAVTKNGTSAGRIVDVTNQASGTITFQTGTLSSTSTAGTGILLTNADGTVSFNGTTTLNGGDAGIDVEGGSGGTVSFAAAATVTDPTNEAIRIVGSSPTFTYSGRVTKNNGTAGILVNGNTGGTISFGSRLKQITATGANHAVSLTSNGTAAISSADSLQVASAAGTAFNATGGGTVTVTGPRNTASASGGVGVNIQNTTIGAGNVTFRSVTATGTGYGIRLENTGTTGGLKVTGDGSNANSGGIITLNGTTASDSAGVTLSSTAHLSLEFMRISITTGNGASGIVGNNVQGTNLIRNTVVDYNQTAPAAVPQHTAFAMRFVQNNTNATITVDGVNLKGKRDGTTAGSLSAQGNSTVTFNVLDSNTGDSFQSRFEDLFGSGWVIGAGDSPGSTATVNLTVRDSRFVNATANGTNNLEMGALENATLNYKIKDNVFDNVADASFTAGIININTLQSGRIGATTAMDSIVGNTINNSGTGALVADLGYIGIRIALENNVAGITHRVVIANNTITDLWRQGILLSSRDQNNGMNVKVANNTIGTAALPVGQSNRRGIETDLQSNSVMNLELTGNNIVGAGTSDANAAVGLRVGTNSGSATLNATVLSNTIGSTDAGTDGRFRAESGTTGTGTLCLDLRTNSLEDNTKLYTLLQTGGTFRVEGPGTAAVTNADITAANTVGTGNVSGTVTFNNNTSCTQPAV